MSKYQVKGSNIFVTGGAGFVGSYVIERLLRLDPRKIFIVDNLVRGSLENMQSFIADPRVEFIEGDIRDKSLVESLMRQSDYCFHFAALRINQCAADPKEAYDVMIAPTFRLIEQALEFKLKKFVFASTASVYGMAKQFPTPETEPPYDNKTFYGAAKFFGEQMLRSYHDQYGLDYAALRYFNIYGPRMDIYGKYTEVMIKWLDCIREERPPLIFGDGSTSMDCVFIEDIADATVRALTEDVTDEVFNVGSEREVNLRELLDLMLRVNGSKLKAEHRPENKANPVQRRLADISKAKEMLGFVPSVSLEEGIRLLSEWYFEQKGVLTQP